MDMNMNWTTIGIIAAAAIILLSIVIILVRKRKRLKQEALEELSPAAEEPTEEEGEEPAEPAEETAGEEPEKGVSEQEAVEAKPEEEKAEAKPEAPAAEKPAEDAPGVKLDDKAEQKAVDKLEEARKARKMKRLRQGLAPTRGGLFKKIGVLFQSKKEIDPAILEDLEDMLVSSDVGTKTTELLVNVLRNALEKDELTDSDAVWEMLKEEVRQILTMDSAPIDVSSDKPYVILVVGVNGVGKTTTIGKLATQYTDAGHKVVLAAADTFRAAAVNQLEIWARRSGAEIVKSKEGADPSSVVFDSIKKAKEIGADIVIADTAGRLHTKVSLMEEVKKIERVTGKAHEGAPHQVLLVLDATTGQNAVSQVTLFKESLNISGLVVTKLDGTAKGGVIIGICHEHKLPIRFIGIGEAKDDLREFETDDFVDALFYKEDD